MNGKDRTVVRDQRVDNPQAAHPANSTGLEHSIKPAWSLTDMTGSFEQFAERS